MRTAMKNRKTFVSTVVIARVLITLAIACALCGRAVAQTAGGTVISNQASATYSDGTNSYSTVSNTVTDCLECFRSGDYAGRRQQSDSRRWTNSGAIQFHGDQHRKLYRQGPFCAR